MVLDGNKAGAGAIDAMGQKALHYAVECANAEDGNEALKIILDAFPGALGDNEGGVSYLELLYSEEVSLEKESEEKETDVVVGRKRSVQFA